MVDFKCRNPRAFVSIIVASVFCIGAPPISGATPTLFSTPNYQGPVYGDPDDLLMIPGYGFASTDTVIYQALPNTTSPLIHPTSIPTSNSATMGVAPIASANNIPDSLTVQLPSVMQKNQSYALWVRDSNGA